MSRRRPLRAPFLMTVAALGTSLACGGSTSSDGTPGGAGGVGGGGVGGTTSTGGSGGGGGNPSCPSSFPEHGGACSLPTETSCYFSQGPCCPDWQAACIDGSWHAYASSCNPPPPGPCPDAPPSAGTACGSSDPCGSLYQYCQYEQCPDGSARIVAECNGGVWSVAEHCAPPPCDGLSACDCFARTDCQTVSDSCICHCDYNCPGVPDCVCACGGGNYLGCESAATDY